ncbi:very-short-patch-repair endonuclease [Paraburkholderia sp. UCT70]|uniref:DUF4011 domain-containing protein n=1 Tax=Paraburkholderia sp. UCT70 TaxID=2991068 RepID=UPI003D1F520D
MNQKQNDVEAKAPGSEESVFSGNLPIREALNQLRLRLLDLTSRNRLLNFTPSAGKTLQFVHCSAEAVYRRLIENPNATSVTLVGVPEPERSAWVSKNGRLTRPEARDYASSIGLATSYELPADNIKLPATSESGSQMTALYYAEDLAGHCRKIEREAKLALEETGANMLYLALGFLDYPEKADSDKLFRAPLVSVPVNLVRVEGTKHDTYRVAFTGEELTENISLREKLKRDFGLSLPVFNEETHSLSSYLDEVEATIELLPRWKVRRMATLSLLSFATMLLVRELGPENWPTVNSESALLAHPVVRQVFEGSAHKSDGAREQYAPEYPIDEHAHANIPLIYDADSSQHSALIDAIEGKNGVIEGPPGTGKSQTITNLIAAALFMGKSVLFVSEKLAALEVVKTRLAQAGLEPFLLELHSNKTDKKRVLDDMEKRISFKPVIPAGLDERIETLRAKRDELKAYADLLNSVHGNSQELTVHQVLWRAERYRQQCEDAAKVAEELLYPPAPNVTLSQFKALTDRLSYVAKQFQLIDGLASSHPWWGFFPEELQPGDEVRLERLLSQYIERFERFGAAMRGWEAVLGEGNLDWSHEAAEPLTSSLEALDPSRPDDIAFDSLPNLFTADDTNGDLAEQALKRLDARLQNLKAVHEDAGRFWLRDAPPSDEELRASEEHGKVIARMDLGTLVMSEAQRIPETLRSGISRAERGLSQLTQLAAASGLPFDTSASGLAQTKAVLAVVKGAPDAIHHFRHDGLLGANSASVLRKAKVDLAELDGRRAKLDETLYLDAIPKTEDVEAAVATLRQGSAWYRIFQGPWRRAGSLHRGLERSKKSKKSHDARLKDLEVLLLLQADTSEWEQRESVKRVAGEHFDGRNTPFKELALTADWLVDAKRALTAAQVPTTIFDPLSVDANRIAALRAYAQRADAALGEVDAFWVAFKEGIPSNSVAAMQVQQVNAVQQQLELVERFAHQLEGALAAYSSNVAPSSSFSHAVHAVKGAHTAAGLRRAVDADLEAQLLLGTRLKGKSTDLRPVLAALTYGRLVKQAKLPAAVEGALLSPSCARNHARLTAVIREIVAAWEAVSSFSRDMGGFGSFDFSQWMGGKTLGQTEIGAEAAGRARLAVANMDALLPWVQYFQLRSDAEKYGLKPFYELVESGQIQSEHLVDVFAYRFYSSIADTLFRYFPRLSRFSGTRHSSVRADFAALDREIIRLRGQQVAAQCGRQRQLPEGRNGVRVADKSEMSLIRFLVKQSRPRVPVRKMLQQAGTAIQQLKPAFLMGPEAVAKFLTPGAIHFDMVIMDEASQLKPEEAIGAIARGRQLIVVGDPKQLPPTSFFSSMGQNADGNGNQIAAVDAESILDLCISHFQPIRSLRWHYRSRHESLIAFSNSEFYDGKLVVFPSPYPKGKALGVRYHYVGDGVYENQMNDVEAARVADAVVDHIMTRREDSLGVVTLNVHQRDLIDEKLAERLRSLPAADDYRKHWDSVGMDLFVKNLENVQGDERDCIIISTTFGKAKGTTVVRQSFGPISQQGGWRRLNVLFTRARKSVAVFSSMQPEDIVLDEKTPLGTRALRNYLAFARTGTLPHEKETGLEPDSDFEVAVIDVLRASGYEVTPQLGVAGFRIDIAVKHPDYPSSYLAAVECDGATYHSGVSVRDRDRIRQEILESLGWKGKIWRIWSTDWFRSPRSETAKLLSFLESLKQAAVPPELLAALVPALLEPAFDTAEAPKVRPAALPSRASMMDDLFAFADQFEISVGDIVTYSPADNHNDTLTVRITAHRTDVAQGLIAQQTPLAQILLGATVGETVVLRVPAMPTQALLIREVKRDSENEAA